MKKDFLEFVARYKNIIYRFVAIYAVSIVIIQGINVLSSLYPASALVESFLLVSFAGSIVLLFFRMKLFYDIVAAFKPIQTKLSRAIIDTVRIYILYFFKAVLIFLPFTILASVVYVAQVPLETIEAYLESSSFIMLSMMLIVLFQVVYAVVAFKIIFVPHVNSATSAMGNKQKIQVSSTLIGLNKKTLLILYSMYQSVVVVTALLVSFIDSLHLITLIALIAGFTEILWSVVVCWQFIRINETREQSETLIII